MDKTVIELFAGVGGFRVGLNNVTQIDENGKANEKNNWKFVWASQWEPSTKTQHAFDCYVQRFENPGAFSNIDISIVDKNEIPNHSLLVGGFPCQDYSVARTKSNEKGIQGKKGVLFWEIAKTLEIKKSPFVLLENVDRLIKSPARQRGRDFGIILRTFADLGYNLEWRIINSADYGCAQRRRRVYIFAWRKELEYNTHFNNLSVENYTLRDSLLSKSFPVVFESQLNNNLKIVNLFNYYDTADMTENFYFQFENSGILKDGIVYTLKTKPELEKPINLIELREESDDLSKYLLNMKQIEKFQYLKSGKRIKRIKPNGDNYIYSEGGMKFPDCLDLPGRTILTSEGSVNRSTHVIEDKSSKKLRFITPVEAERMQCFPDNWTKTGMPDSKRYFMMGNAIVTKIVNRLEPELKRIIENE